MNIKSNDVSPLGAVMACLFSGYVVMNASESCHPWSLAAAQCLLPYVATERLLPLGDD